MFRAARDVLRQVIVRRVSRGLDLAGDLGVRIRLASSVGALNALAERLVPSCPPLAESLSAMIKLADCGDWHVARWYAQNALRDAFRFSLAKTLNVKTRYALMRLITASAGLANLVLPCGVRFQVVNGCCCADMPQ